MAGLSVTILGAGGFLGAQLAAQLLSDGLLYTASGNALADPRLAETPISTLILFDLHPPRVPANPLGIKVLSLSGDISDIGRLRPAIPQETAVVFHLAAIVSGQAEADYPLGRKVNIGGTETLCALLAEHTTAGSPPARVIFTSSVASFSIDPTTLTSPSPTANFLSDASPQRPLNSYGAQKAMMELLLSDLSRRGMLDAVNIRLPTISVRPGLPNAAASGFLSSLIREPLLGLPAICPVPEEDLGMRVWLASPLTAVGWLRWCGVVETTSAEAKARWGPFRSVTPPGISTSIREIFDAVARADADAVKLVRFEKDERVLEIVGKWPPGFHTERGVELGFLQAVGGIDGIVGEFLEVGMEQTRVIRGM